MDSSEKKRCSEGHPKHTLEHVGKPHTETSVLSVGEFGAPFHPHESKTMKRDAQGRYPNNLALQLCISHDEWFHKRKVFQPLEQPQFLK